MTTSAASTGPRISYLDGIRASAALFVLVHHAFCMAYPINEGIRPQGLIGVLFGWVVYGHFGVTVFIALAGYSLTLAVVNQGDELRDGATGFMRRRAWRIIPPYWAAMLLTLVLVVTYIGQPQGTHWDLSVPPDRMGWLLDAVLLQDLSALPNAAYTFWSIAVEWHIYLLLPAMVLLRRRTRTWLWPLAIGAAGSTVGVFLSALDHRFNRLHFEYYLIFVLAVGMCVLVDRRPRWFARTPWLSVGGVLALAVVIICIEQPYLWVASQYRWIDLLMGGAVLCLLAALGRGAPRSAALLSWRPLAGVGTFSYSLYLVHAPLLAVFWEAAVVPLNLGRSEALALLWMAAVPLILTASYGFYLIAERPFVSERSRAAAQAKVLGMWRQGSNRGAGDVVLED